MSKLEFEFASAKISALITRWVPLYCKVTRVIDRRTLEMTSTVQSVNEESFWEGCIDPIGLSNDEKGCIYLQYRTSHNSGNAVVLFAYALKSLCDNGFTLCHESKTLADIWVMNCKEFDVCDLLERRILRLQACGSDRQIRCICTHENIDLMAGMEPAVLANFGFVQSAKSDTGDVVKVLRPQNYRCSGPHWWIAGPVGPERKDQQLVHADICGGAFDDRAIRREENCHISLDLFCTPRYYLVPMQACFPTSQQQFFLQNEPEESVGQHGSRIEPEPWHVRHMRCYHVPESPPVMVSALETFLNKYWSMEVPGAADFEEEVAKLIDGFVRDLPEGTKVRISGLKKRTELNGREGHVHGGKKDKEMSERIHIMIDGMRRAFHVPLRSVRPLGTGRQYKTYMETLEKIGCDCPTCGTVGGGFEHDEDVRAAWELMEAGIFSMSSCADKKVLKGVKKLVSKKQEWPEQVAKHLDTYIEVVDMPRSREVFLMVKMLKKAQGQDAELYRRMLQKVGKKVHGDELLKEVWEKMEKVEGGTLLEEMERVAGEGPFLSESGRLREE